MHTLNLKDHLCVTHDLIEDMEGGGAQLENETAELETHEKAEQSNSIIAQNKGIAEIEENTNMEKDIKEITQLEEFSDTLHGNQEITNETENNEIPIVPGEDTVASSYEQIKESNDDEVGLKNIN